MRPEPLELHYEPLPPMRPVAPFAGMKSRHVELLGAVSCAVSPDDREWAVISASGRKIKIPSTASSNKSCSAGVACLMAELRETMNGQVAFALQEEREGSGTVSATRAGEASSTRSQAWRRNSASPQPSTWATCRIS